MLKVLSIGKMTECIIVLNVMLLCKMNIEGTIDLWNNLNDSEYFTT